MKEVKKGLGTFLGLLLASGVAMLAAPGECVQTNELYKTYDSSVWNNAYHWVNYGTTTRSGANGDPLSGDADYLVSKHVTDGVMRTPSVASGAQTFGGRSLIIGTDDYSGTLQLMAYGTSVLKFPNMGLVLHRGDIAMNSGYDKTYTLDGSVIVQSPLASPFAIRSAYTNATLNLNASVSGGVSAAVLLRNVAGKDPLTINMTKDSSTYDAFWIVTNENPIAIGKAPGMTLKLGSAYVAGVELNANTVLRPSAASTVMDVGTLVLKSGCQIAYQSSYTITSGALSAATNSFITVRTGLALPDEGKVVLRLPRLLQKPDGKTDSVPLLRAPAGTLDADRFEFVPDSSVLIYPYSPRVETSGGYDTLYADTVKVVVMTSSDEGGTTAGTGTSAFASGAKWSDGNVPQKGVNYLVSRINGSLLTIRSGAGGTFAGDSLTIDDCNLYIFDNTMTFETLRLLSGSAVGQYNGSQCWINAKGIEVQEGEVRFNWYNSRTLTFSAPLVGAGTIWMQGVDSTSAPKGTYQLSEPSPGFTGRIRMVPRDSSRMKTFDETKMQVLKVFDARALGGDPVTFDPKSVQVGNYGIFTVNDSMTFEHANRGFYFSEKAVVDVPSGKTATFLAPCTFAGELLLRGPGTSAFGGSVKFDVNGTIADEPVPDSGMNLLTVLAGDVKALSSTCMDGLVVAFSNATSRILIDADTLDSVLASNGVVNVKTDTPFVLADGVLNIHLTLKGSVPLDKKVGHEIGLVTVSSNAARQLRGHISVTIDKGVIGRCLQTVEERTDPDTGDVTFYLSTEPPGFALIGM